MKQLLVSLVVIGWSVWTTGHVVGQDVSGSPPGEKPAAVTPGETIARPKTADKKPRYWTTRWSLEDIDVGKLTARLSSIGIDVGVLLDGTVSIEFHVGVPWTSLGDAAAYRFDGTLTSPSLIVENVRMRNLNVHLVYREGTATLTPVHAELIQPDAENVASEQTGTIRGSGSVELVPRGEVRANLHLENLALAPITELITRFQDSVAAADSALVRAGTVSADVQFAAPLDSISSIETYHLQGRARGESVSLRGLPPATFDLSGFSIVDGIFNLQHFDLLAANRSDRDGVIRLQGKANVAMTGDRKFNIRVVADDLPTGAVADLLSRSDPAIEGKLDFRGTARGRLADTLAESHWEITASVASPRLRIGGVDLGVLEHDLQLTRSHLAVNPRRPAESLPDSVRIGQIQCDYEITDEILRIDRVDAGLFGGQFAGSASVPLEASGLARVDLQFSAIRPVMALPFPSSSPPSVSASLGGELKWEVPIEKIGQPAAHRGTGRIRIEEMRIGDEPLGWIAVSVSANEGKLSLEGDGEVLDGTLHVRMLADADADDRWSDLSQRLRASELRFSDLSIQRGLWVSPYANVPLRGRMSGALIGSGTPNVEKPSSPLRFELDVDGMRYRDVLLSQHASLRGGFDGDVVSIDSLAGNYAGGAVRMGGRVQLRDDNDVLHPRADLTLRVDRVDLHRGLFFVSGVAEQIRGKASGSARITVSERALQLRGRVNGSSLVLSEFPVGVAHSGIRMDVDAITRQWDLRLPTISSSVGGGWLDGELAVSSPRRGREGVDLASRWKTRRVDFFRLSQQLGSATSRATGKITGELTIGGEAIRSVDDLAGRFRFQLGETRGASVPGLVGISRYLGPISLATEKFTTGAARGVIGNGVMAIDEFWLGSDAALVQADGQLYLRSKRLNLDAIVATGDYTDIASDFDKLIERYVLRTFLPASVILDLSALLRDRTLVVKILGTMDYPIVRLQPVETFREEAARFLLREGRRLILSGITAGAIDGVN